MVLMSFISGMIFHSFQPSYFFILIYSSFYLFYIIHHWYKHRDIFTYLREQYLTAAFICFILCSVMVFFITLHHGADLYIWDEFAHWGQMTKELLRLDYFYITTDTTLMFHNDYPPAIPLFESLWCWFSGQYDERIVYASLQLLQLSFLLFPIDYALLGKRREKTVLYGFLTFVIVFFFTLFDFSSDSLISCFYLYIYPDSLMAVMAGFSIYYVIWVSEKVEFYYGYLYILLAVLVLSKQIGIFFVGLVIFAFLCKKILGTDIGAKHIKCNVLMPLFGMVFVSIICLGLWNTIFSIADVASRIPPQFHAPFKEIVNLPGIMTGSDGTVIQQRIVCDFLQAIVNRSLSHSIFLSYTFLLGLFFIGMVCFLWHSSDKKRWFVMALTIITGSLVYAFILLCMYLFVFDDKEGPALASYNRYMGTYIFVVCVSLFSRILDLNLQDRLIGSFVKKALLYCSVVVLVITSHPSDFLPQFLIDENLIGNKDDRYIAASLQQYTSLDDSIFIINQAHDEADNNWIAYYIDGRKINRGIVSFSSDTNTDNYDCTLTTTEFQSILEKYDYLFLKHIDEGFLKAYSSLFDSNVIIHDNMLFQISRDSTGNIITNNAIDI